MSDNWPAALEDAHAKVERVDELGDELLRGIREFIVTDPVGVVEELDPTSGDRLVKIKLLRPMPRRLQTITGDVLTNLRSALDYLAGELHLKHCKKRGKVYFPFAKSRDAFLRQTEKELENNFGAHAAEEFKRVEPYPGGNDLLHALHETRNVDSHNFLVPLSTEGTLAFARYINVANAKVGFKIPKPGRLDEGLVISNLGTSGTFSFSDGGASGANLGSVGASIEMAFGDIPMLKGRPVIGTLVAMQKEVTGVLERFHSEFSQ